MKNFISFQKEVFEHAATIVCGALITIFACNVVLMGAFTIAKFFIFLGQNLGLFLF